MTAIIKSAGRFVGNLLTALFGTSVIVSELYRMIPVSTRAGTLRKEVFLSAVVAFVLGYLVYYKWKLRSAQWIAVAGLCWFGWGALHFWLGQRDLRVVNGSHSILWEMAGVGCSDYDYQSCSDLLTFTDTFVRTVFYSAGAFCCSRFGPLGFQRMESAVLGHLGADGATRANGETDDDSNSKASG